MKRIFINQDGEKEILTLLKPNKRMIQVSKKIESQQTHTPLEMRLNIVGFNIQQSYKG